MDHQTERVRLAQDFTDEFGQQFRAGQTGVASSRIDDCRVVDFDGYEAERAAAAEQRKRDGEGPNVVPWAALVPVRLLEVEKQGA